MADESDLQARGFRVSEVTARGINIDHGDTTGLGPFCRLIVNTAAPALPGVYAWVASGAVMYVGMARELIQIVDGARMNRAYNDYTYVPPSKVRQMSSPRVRINGLINRAMNDGPVISWWWLALATVVDAKQMEAKLIGMWEPPWNRTRPSSI